MASKKKRKLNMRSGKGSSTAGILKGDNCKKSPLKIRYARDSRFYKTDPLNYLAACAEIDKLNK